MSMDIFRYSVHALFRDWQQQQYRSCREADPRQGIRRSFRPVDGSETRHRHRAGFEPVRVNHPADDGSGAHGGELFRVSSCPDGLENGSCALGEQCGNRETGNAFDF